MSSGEFVVLTSLTNFLPSHDLYLLSQVVPLSLLLGVAIDQEPSIHVSFIRMDVKQHFMFEVSCPATGQTIWA